MRIVQSLVLGSVAAFAIAGAGTMALAHEASPAGSQATKVHHMTVRLDGGGVAHIDYTGNIAPQIIVLPGAGQAGGFVAPNALFAPSPPLFAPDATFAALDQVSAAMDRQIASLMREVQEASMIPPATFDSPTEILNAKLPAGSTGYSVVSSWSGNGTCSRSIQVPSFADGRKPQVVSKASGNCAAAPGAGLSTGPHTQAPAPGHSI